MLGDGATSYDLDSTASNWDAGTGNWVSQNIQYFPYQETRKSPPSTSPKSRLMKLYWAPAGTGPIRIALKQTITNPKINPNYAIGAAIDPGHGICVRTVDNTAVKTDGGHYALLVVLARTSTTLTLEITVWQQQPSKEVRVLPIALSLTCGRLQCT
jgi:hypothetical protein